MAFPEKKISLKILIDSKRNKVIFAEAGNDFMDILFGFLTLPVGTIIQQLDKRCDKQAKSPGCLNNLYASVKNLDSSNFRTPECKLMLLYPKNASEVDCRKLKLAIDDSEPTIHYKCENFVKYMNGFKKIICQNSAESIYKVKCSCGGFMNSQQTFVVNRGQGGTAYEGVFTASSKSFIVTDDLRLMPTTNNSSFEFLRNLVGGADVTTEEKIVSIGSNEIMHLLRLSSISRTPLTNLFQQIKSNTIINPESIFMAHSSQWQKALKTNVSMKLKALVQKSTCNSLLFLAGADFVEFLVTILSIPLGGVVSLLDGNSNIGSVDNLYRSISEIGFVFFKSYREKDLLINPKLPPHYLSQKTNHFLPLSEKSDTGYLLNPKGGPDYIKGEEMFIVTDSLVVTPLSFMSIISYLHSREIPYSDVEEFVFQVGTKEAFDILRSSLTSRDCALSNVLQSLIEKQPKK